MSSANKIVALIDSGFSLQIKRRSDQRILMMTRLSSISARQVDMPRSEYLVVMDGVVSWLKERIAGSETVTLHMDFHGRQWVELPRRGVFRVGPKLYLPDRYMQQLRDELNKRQGRMPDVA